jgi:hypothetical protein
MCIGKDPVVLPRISRILEQMYKAGYLAAVDVSKCFYQFPTHPEDRKYLGLLHPVMGILFILGSPDGGGNQSRTCWAIQTGIPAGLEGKI